MVFGELEDPGKEFFVQSSLAEKSKVGLQDRVIGILVEAGKGNKQQNFDWNSSFYLRLEYLPEGVVGSKVATKIMFAGKAVKLLRSGGSPDAEKSSVRANEVLRYLSRGVEELDSMLDHEAGEETADDEAAGKKGLGSRLNSVLQANGYTVAEVASFTEKFKGVLAESNARVAEDLESVVNEINDAISQRLWRLLKYRLGFLSFLQVVRNTYLLGKGELFQCVIDGILEATLRDVPGTTKEMNTLLNWKIVKNTAKLLGVDDDEMTRVLRLNVDSCNVHIDHFSERSLPEVSLAGTAVIGVRTAQQPEGKSMLVSMCAPPDVSSAAVFQELWGSFLMQPIDEDTTQAPMQKQQQQHIGVYTGCLWLNSLKYISKGFTAKVEFSCDWTVVKAFVSSSSMAADVLELGCVKYCFHSDRRIIQAADFKDPPGSLSVGVRYLASVDLQSSAVRYTAKLSIQRHSNAFGGSLSLRDSTASLRGSMDSQYKFLSNTDVATVAEVDIKIDDQGFSSEADLRSMLQKKLDMLQASVLEVEYYREINGQQVTRSAVKPTRNTADTVLFKMRARISNARLQSTHDRDSAFWDIDVPLELPHYVRCAGGQVYVGAVASGLDLLHDDTAHHQIENRKSYSVFNFHVRSLQFESKSAIATYPVASPYTSTRFPETFLLIDREVNRIRSWLQLKLELSFPAMFKVIFDTDAVGSYERIFGTIMKIRLMATALEKLWIARSRLVSDRIFCHMRHAMHFFISNLLYYLQVDVIDSEFSTLLTETASLTDFQSVLKAHKVFLTNVSRLSFVDNNAIQEGIDKVLQVCLRFVAVCRVLNSTHEGQESTIFVPPQEFDAIRTDFFAQVSFLFEIMRRVESRGFIFRLDFNGFLSKYHEN